MCKLCRSAICPPKCPNYEQKGAEKVFYCSLCGDRLSADKEFYQKDGFPYCSFCLQTSELESIIRICEKSFSEGIALLGFLPCGEQG